MRDHTLIARRLGISTSAVDAVARELDQLRRDRRNNDRMPRGEMHHSAKLTEAAVREIRHRAKWGVDFHRLANAYRVHPETIRAIVKRRTWKHVR